MTYNPRRHSEMRPDHTTMTLYAWTTSVCVLGSRPHKTILIVSSTRLAQCPGTVLRSLQSSRSERCDQSPHILYADSTISAALLFQHTAESESHTLPEHYIRW